MVNINNETILLNGIQSLLHYNFIYKKKYAVADIAPKMGISEVTLYKYISGDNSFPADRLVSLILATGDSEYLDYIAERVGFVIIPKLRVSAIKKNIRDLEIEIARASGLTIDATERALMDGGINKKEQSEILKKATDIVRNAEALKESVKANVAGLKNAGGDHD